MQLKIGNIVEFLKTLMIKEIEDDVKNRLKQDHIRA